MVKPRPVVATREDNGFEIATGLNPKGDALPLEIIKRNSHFPYICGQNKLSANKCNSRQIIGGSFSVQGSLLAERERFELSVQRLTTHPLSRRTP
jgi:hypothetical protein